MINNVNYNRIPMNNNLNPTYQFINNTNINIKLNNNNNLLSVEEQREENQKRILEEF